MQSRIGPVTSLSPRLSTAQSWSGVSNTRTVASNSVGFGAVLRPDAAGELVEADGSAAPLGPGLFIALEAGTGTRRVLYWGSGWVRNDAWSLTPGAPLYLSTDTPGSLSHSSNGAAPIGFAESATVAFFGPVHSSFTGEAATASITMTISGTDFEAVIALDTDTYPDAEALWTFPDASTSSSTHPDVTGVGAGDVVLEVTPAAALTYLNFGYDAGDDGPVEIDLLAQQNVTAISGLSSAPGLEIICGSNNPVNSIDLRGLSALTDAEIMSCTSLDTLLLGGNTSLWRLCIEGSSVEELDISGCTALTDIRAGSNGMTNLIWGAIGPLMDHVCCNQNPALNALPAASVFETVNQFLMFGSNQSGALVFNSPDLGDIAIQDNAYTSLDISTGCGAVNYINAANNALTSVNLANNSGLTYVYLQNNSLSESQVDTALAVLDAYGTANGEVNLSGNASPSAAGMTSVASLQGRGWTVTVGAGAPSVIWQDTFDRADTTELDNGWAGHDADGQITSNALVSDAGGYGIIYNDITLPNDHEVTWTIPHSRVTTDQWWGIATSINTTTFSGAGVFFQTDPGSPGAIDCGDPFGGSPPTLTVTGDFPTSWSVDQDHTIGLRRVGNTVQVMMDGQEYGTFPWSGTGTAVGVIGEGGKNWLDVTVTTAS